MTPALQAAARNLRGARGRAGKRRAASVFRQHSAQTVLSYPRSTDRLGVAAWFRFECDSHWV